MRASLLSTTILAVVLAGCGHAKRDAVADRGGGSVAASDPALAGLNPNPPAMTGKVFADTAAASDLLEIESSELAQGRNASAAVKAFARMMVEDHTRSTEQLKAAAGQAGVALEPQLSSGQEADLTDLRFAGARFDRVYAEKQIVAHANALAGLRKYAAQGDSKPLRAFASGALPVVEHHLAAAKDLAR